MVCLLYTSGIFLNPVRICFIGPVLRKGQGHERHVPLVEILLGYALSLVQVIEALHVFNGIQDMGVCKGQLLLIPVIKPSPAGVNRISPCLLYTSNIAFAGRMRGFLPLFFTG